MGERHASKNTWEMKMQELLLDDRYECRSADIAETRASGRNRICENPFRGCLSGEETKRSRKQRTQEVFNFKRMGETVTN